MAMNPSALKSKMKTTIYNGLKAQFGSSAGKGKDYSSVADENWQKMAEAISGIALDIVMEIVQNAQVMPGIPTAGSPASQTSVGPGKIL
jgi:uncharacterized protein (DUF362 family)